MKLDTGIVPIVPLDEQTYHAVATSRDPRTDEGMEGTPACDVVNQSRIRAIQLARKWAGEGYWGSVYNQKTGECVIDYAPKGDGR